MPIFVYIFGGLVALNDAELAISSLLLHVPWMYRQPSLGYFVNKENLKTCGLSGKFWSFKERFFPVICKRIYGRVLAMDIEDNYILTQE